MQYIQRWVRTYLNQVVIGPIQVFVQLDDQGLEEGGELSLLLGSFILGHSRLKVWIKTSFTTRAPCAEYVAVRYSNRRVREQ